jgi:GH25 family lysozyme M1 (1,4-beta-N-acetylmuramidase)
MKNMKKILSLILAVCIIICAVPCAYAADADEDILGDTDGDGLVMITDATVIQQHLAGLKDMDDEAALRADADLDGITGILDVTRIQKYLARFTDISYVGMALSAAKLLKSEDDHQDILDSIENYQTQKGVDISVYNGDVDMNVLKEQGYSFVMIRMGYGSNLTDQDDWMFEENVRKAEEAGIPWGAYLYSYALNVKSAQSEVQHTLRLLEGKHPTMPIAFDIEDDDYKYSYGMPSDQTLRDICLTYLSGIAAAGYYPILYTGYSWLTGALDCPEITSSYDIWYAQWWVEMEYDTERVGMWQYGGETNYLESPYISGLSGMFDKDYCFKNYPVIIPAYGYNNHEAIIKSDKEVASTSATCGDYHKESGERVPEGYIGTMGSSFK